MRYFPVFVGVLISLAIFDACNCYKILAFFPFPAKSHHKVWDPLLKELAIRGHQVTALKSFSMDDPPQKNYREIMISDVLQEVIKMFGDKDSFSRLGFFQRIFVSVLFKSSGLVMGELWMKEPGIQEVLKTNDTFDAVLFESGFMQEYFTTLQHRFNAVGIEVSATGNFHWIYWLFGNPIDTSYVVDAAIGGYSDRMTFFERFHLTTQSNLVRMLWYEWFGRKYQQFMDDNIRYPGWESRPSMKDMISDTSLVLVNTDVALTYPHPMSPHFIEIGGINVLPNKPLPKDLQDFMDGANDGVIFFTLGSHIQVSTIMGDKLRDAFSQVFSRLKQRVLWKWEKDDFKNIPSNVKISKWFPQQDILAHKNIKLFISHGGFLSMTEAVYFGVPLVGIPIMADQDKNIKFVEERGLGVHLALENITEESVNWAVNEVITQPKYKERALEQSKLLRDKPMKPLEKAVYWTEYAIRHKGAHHLKPALATMPWYQQALIDVYAAIAAVFVLATYVILKMIKCTLKCFGLVKKQKKE